LNQEIAQQRIAAIPKPLFFRRYPCVSYNSSKQQQQQAHVQNTHTAMSLWHSARAILFLLFLVSFALVNWAQAFDIDLRTSQDADLVHRRVNIPDISEETFIQRERVGEPDQPTPRSKVGVTEI
jgi:hypothetical protein